MSRYDPQIHHRHSIRLRGWDYTSTAGYFVTICTHERECLFGAIANGHLRYSREGKVAARCWEAIPDHFAHVILGRWVVMPNHVHGILVFGVAGAQVGAQVGAQHAAPLPDSPSVPHVVPGSLGAVIRSYKAAVTREINVMDAIPGRKVWQRNYWDHIIRDDNGLWRIQEYIANNPARWQSDRLNTG